MANQTKVVAAASSLLIEPISQTENTIKGRVHSVGENCGTKFKMDDIVYYNQDEVNAILYIPQKVHAVFNYRIFAIEFVSEEVIADFSSFADNEVF